MRSSDQPNTLVRLIHCWSAVGAALPFFAMVSVRSQAEDFAYTNNNGALTITGYSGSGGDVTIPRSINGMPVTTIADGSFAYNTNLTKLTIPDSVTNMLDGPLTWYGCEGAFVGCTSLTNVVIGKGLTFLGVGSFNVCTSLLSVYFKGNAPQEGSYGIFYIGPFWGASLSTLYYLPGTTGWRTTSYDGRPEILWNPQMVTDDPGFGVKQGGFGFNIAGTPGIPLAVEASTSLAGGTWVQLQNCTLTNGLVYFSDQQWTNHQARFYRIRSP